MQGLESLGGFGGVADRLNMYNHFLKDPGYLAAGCGALSRSDTGVREDVRDQATPEGRARRH